MPVQNSASALEEAAARWALRVDAGTLSAQEEAELEAWTAADVRHAGAFARALAASAYLDRAVALGAHGAAMPVAQPAPAEQQPGRSQLSRRMWMGGAAGALAASLVVAVGLKPWSRAERLSTPRGSIRRVALADGSALTLNTGASVEVDFAPQTRGIRLLAGEANFDVTHDKARPFTVDAGIARIQVVGTSFLVRLLEVGSVSVTVREGIVDVRTDLAGVTRLLAGDRLIVLANGQGLVRDRLTPAAVDKAGLWQSGELDLTGMTLGDAAAEFARYSDRPIVIADPAVARLKVAGIYSISDPAGFAQAAADSMDLHLEQSDTGLRLSRRR
jgi:transmembrane sensor